MSDTCRDENNKMNIILDRSSLIFDRFSFHCVTVAREIKNRTEPPVSIHRFECPLEEESRDDQQQQNALKDKTQILDSRLLIGEQL